MKRRSQGDRKQKLTGARDLLLLDVVIAAGHGVMFEGEWVLGEAWKLESEVELLKAMW